MDAFEIGLAIRNARKERRVTQAALAQVAGLSARPSSGSKREPSTTSDSGN